MSLEAIAWAPAQDAPTPTAKSVLKALAPWVQADGRVWLYVDIIAVDVGVSVRSVQRGLADLRAAGLLIDTGEWQVDRGKRLPIYRVPLDQGYANLRQRMTAERRGDAGVTPKSQSGVTPMSPQNRRGDADDTPRGDTGVTQKERDNKTLRSSNELPRGASAPDDGFDEALDAFHPTGQARTDEPEARREWGKVVAEVGREPALGCVRRYVAEDHDLKHGDHGAPGFHRWLAAERWRRWLRAAEPAAAAPKRTPFAGPEEIAALVGRLLPRGRDRADELLQACTWREADRTILTRTTWAAGKLREEIGAAELRENNLRIEHQGSPS